MRDLRAIGPAVVTDLAPDLAIQRHAAALDLDDGDAIPGQATIRSPSRSSARSLKPQVAEEDGVVGQLLLERPDEQLLGRRGELRLVGEEPRRHTRLPATEGASTVTMTPLC